MAEYSKHQFNLYPHSATRPKRTVPISAAEIQKAKEMMQAGNGAEAARIMRTVRERLEAFEARLTNGREAKNG